MLRRCAWRNAKGMADYPAKDASATQSVDLIASKPFAHLTTLLG
jgi:hypothetical protein